MDEVAVMDVSHSDGDTIEYLSQESLDNDIAKTKNTSWHLIKPLYKDTLYYKILYSRNMIMTVENWCDSYEINRDNAIVELLQLFIDLSMYQNFKVSEFLDSNELSDIIRHLEMMPEENSQCTGKYLFKLRSKMFLRYHKKIEDFISKVINKSEKNNFLYDSVMMPYTTKMLMLMSSSNFRAIRHTGVIIGLKLITPLVRVIKNIYVMCLDLKKQIGDAQSRDQDTSTLEIHSNELHSNYKILNRIVHIIHDNVLKRNCFLRDPTLVSMREDCIYEIKKWIKILPEKYLKNDALTIVMRAVLDDSKNVRLAALYVFTSLFDNDKYKSELKPNLKKYVTLILGRMMDKDLNVAEYAVDLLALIDKNHRSLNKEHGNRVLLKIYCNYYSLACAAGRFLVQKLRSIFSDDVAVLENLIQYQVGVECEDKILGRRALLVEVVFDCLPILQEMSNYKRLLRNKKLSGHEREVMADIVCEVLIILDTGTSSLERRPKKEPDTAKIVSVLQEIVSNGLNVLEIFSHNFHNAKFNIIVDFIVKYAPNLRASSFENE